jgi:TfoX/Sxy family transcriptional regulator of competence genes
MTMPSFSKSPPELVERFRAMTGEIPDVERRLMFGYPCVFVGGNMITGLYETNWFVRLGDADRDELLQVPGAGGFEVMPGRPMRGYTALPPSIIDDDRAITTWVGRAIDFGRGLPPKAPKAPKTPKATKPKRTARPG